MRKLSKSVMFIFLRFVFGKKLITARCKFLNAKFKCFSRDVLGRHLYKYGMHEPENSRFLLKSLKLNDGDVALDIGANLGWYSVLLNRISTQRSFIYSFEPDLDNFDLLEYNLEKNNCINATAINMAVSNKKDTLCLYKYSDKNLGRHSILPQQSASKVNVNTLCLDNFLDPKLLPKVKFIKIDIEGYEFFALQGATKALEKCPMVMMEFSPQLYPDNSHAKELVNFMVGFGYTPKLLVDGKLVEISSEVLISESRQLEVFWIKQLS